MSDENNLRADADAGRRVEAFLKDDAVKGAFIDLEKRYFTAFKSSKSVEEREALHARVSALTDLFESVLGIKDSGKMAQHKIEAHERAEAGKRTPRTR